MAEERMSRVLQWSEGREEIREGKETEYRER